MDLQLSEYKSFEEKKKFYLCNEVIDNKEDFDKKFAEWTEQSEDYVFRGVNEAKYKMYTSAQRKWIQDADLRCEYIDYYKFVEHLIGETKKLNYIKDYFSKNKIQINDFLILSLLQHFGAPSPFLDFSHNPKIALYFAFNKGKKNKIEGNNVINNYVSIYRININEVEKICSFHKIQKSDVKRINCYLAQNDNLPAHKKLKLNTFGVKKSFENVPYNEYKDLPPIFIVGGTRGETEICSYKLNLKCTYNFTNIRIKCQEGSFILNTSECEPLSEEFINRHYLPRSIIECININKGLKKYIQKKYIKTTKKKLFPKDRDSKHIIETLEDIGLLEKKETGLSLLWSSIKGFILNKILIFRR